MSKTAYVRPAGAAVLDHLREPRRFIQVVSGARQVGKTTLVRQVMDRLGSPARYASADEPGLRGREWIVQQWEAARLLAAQADGGGALLALDEIHKIDGWPETVKGLWDADARDEVPPEGGADGLVAAADPAGPHREPGRSLRGPAPPPLEPRRDARRLRVVTGPVPVLRRLPGSGAPADRARPVGPLRPRRPGRADHRPGRAAGVAGGQARPAAPPVRAGVPVLGPDPLLHQDGGPAPGRGQHHHPGPLPRPDGRGGHGRRAAEIRRRRRPAPGFKPQAAAHRHRGQERPDPRLSARAVRLQPSLPARPRPAGRGRRDRRRGVSVRAGATLGRAMSNQRITVSTRITILDTLRHRISQLQVQDVRTVKSTLEDKFQNH